MNIGLLGYGTVGGGVDILANGKNGMEVTKVLCLDPADVSGGRGVSRMEEIAGDPAIDTVVEAMGGLHPAYEYACAALTAGKNYVTANKALIAAYLPELTELAKQHGAALRCTAAVGGGIPWLVNLERCRRLDGIRRIWGIFNGTTNFILDAMHREEAEFSDVLAQAQRLGYAEADPSADVDGDDVRRKLVISAAAAFGKLVREEDVPTFGIRSVTARDIKHFRELGLVCRLIAEAAPAGGSLSASVEPALLSAAAPEAAVPENYNLISYESENAGWQSFFGQGAGRYPTAYNVVQDCLDLQGGVKSFYAEKLVPASVDCADVMRCYYVRTEAADAWLDGATAKSGGDYRITKPVSQAELHRWAEDQRKKDPGLFFAGIR